MSAPHTRPAVRHAAPAPATSQALVLRARRARGVARGVLDSADTAPESEGIDLALTLLRQAAYWLLLAASNAEARPRPDELWAGTSELRAELGQFPEVLGEVFCHSSAFVAYADRSERELRWATEAMRGFVDALLSRVDAPVRERHRRLAFRGVRITLGAGFFALLAWAAVSRATRRPDLADGKPWRTSSALYECHPRHGDCGGVKTRILFHTREEQAPWFEYDLGALRTFSGVTVRNRSDYGRARAVPLVLDVSNDDRVFREIARWGAPFHVLHASVPRTTARFVRLTVPRRTFLHLESVEIHP